MRCPPSIFSLQAHGIPEGSEVLVTDCQQILLVYAGYVYLVGSLQRRVLSYRHSPAHQAWQNNVAGFF